MLDKNFPPANTSLSLLVLFDVIAMLLHAVDSYLPPPPHKQQDDKYLYMTEF